MANPFLVLPSQTQNVRRAQSAIMTQNINFSPAFSRQPDGRPHHPRAPSGHRSAPRTERNPPAATTLLNRPQTAHTRQSHLIASPMTKPTHGKRGFPNSPVSPDIRCIQQPSVQTSPQLSFTPKCPPSAEDRRLSPAAPEMLVCIGSSNNQSKESVTVDPTTLISIVGFPSDMQTINISSGSAAYTNNQRVSANSVKVFPEDICLVRRPAPVVLPTPDELVLPHFAQSPRRKGSVQDDESKRMKRFVACEPQPHAEGRKRTAVITSCYDELDEWIVAAYNHHQFMLRTGSYH